jgi:hypothetical protein
MAVLIVIGFLIKAAWQAVWFFCLIGASFVIDLTLIRIIMRKNIQFLINGVLQVD